MIAGCSPYVNLPLSLLHFRDILPKHDYPKITLDYPHTDLQPPIYIKAAPPIIKMYAQ